MSVIVILVVTVIIILVVTVIIVIMLISVGRPVDQYGPGHGQTYFKQSWPTLRKFHNLRETWETKQTLESTKLQNLGLTIWHY